MSQPVTSSRLNNSSVNINGASAAVSTNFGLQRIGVTGNSFDISSSSGTVTLGITGTGNVQLGNATSGAVSFPGTTTFATLNSPAVGTNMSVGGNLTTGVLSLGSATSTTNLYGTLDVATIEGPTAGSAMAIGNNITAGSVSIGNAGGANTVTIGNNGAGATGTVNVGVSAATVNIGTNPVGGVVYIGNGSTGTTHITGTNIFFPLPTTGSVFMGVGSAGTLNLGNTGTGNFGVVNISTGGATNISTNGTGSTIIGNTSAPLTLRGSSTTFSSALTLGAAPTTASHLGGTVNGTVVSTIPTNGTSVGSLTLTVPGVYLISFNFKFTNNGNILYINLNNQNAGAYFGYSPIATNEANVSGTFSSAIASNTTTNFIVSYNGTPTLIQSISYIAALRIG